MFNTKSTTKDNSTQAPNIPDWLRGSIRGVGTAYTNLGQRDPQEFVPGVSPLQNQAFAMGGSLAARYGAPQYTQPQQPQPQQPTQPQTGQGLFDSLGVKQPENIDFVDYGQANPDVAAAFDTLTPQMHSNIAQVMGIPSGVVNREQFYDYHNRTHGRFEPGRNRPGANSKTSMPTSATRSSPPPMIDTGGGAYRPGGDGNQMVQMGQPATSGGEIMDNGAIMEGQPSPIASAAQNPLQMYSDAADTARGVINAGPSQVGSAQTYNPSVVQAGQVQDLPGYDPAQAAQVALDQAPTIDGTSYDSQMIEAERAYEAARQAAAGYTPAEVQAQSLLTNLQDYMNPYINDVVDTSLAGFDEDRGRIEAQQAAAAARSGAFGGSRFGVQEGITQGELGRQRADLEAGLRSDAFNTGAGLSADDAGRRQSASAANAAARNAAEQQRLNAEMQRAQMMFTGAQGDQAVANDAARFGAESDFAASQANQQSMLTRLLNQGQLDRDVGLSNMDASNTARQFGAAQRGQQFLTQAGLDQDANLANQAASNRSAEFNANTINDLNRFNASQMDTALDRALRGADSLRTTGSTQEANERAAIGLLQALGADQRGIAQQQAVAPLSLLNSIGSGLANLPLDQITGISRSGTSTTRGVPGLLDYINTGLDLYGAFQGS